MKKLNVLKSEYVCRRAAPPAASSRVCASAMRRTSAMESECSSPVSRANRVTAWLDPVSCKLARHMSWSNHLSGTRRVQYISTYLQAMIKCGSRSQSQSYFASCKR